MNDDELEEKVFARAPMTWPSQSWVELNSVGDPGAWLQRSFGEPIVEVLRDLNDWEQSASQGLAEAYEDTLDNIGFPMPWQADGQWSDDEIETCRKEITQEFVAFLRHWRERATDLL